MIDVLILNYNDAKTTIDCAKRCASYSLVNRVLIVDNCSTDNSFSEICGIQNEKIIASRTSKNGGYGAGNNYGIRYLVEHYHSEYILLTNPDVIVEENSLKGLENFLRNNSEYAIAAPFMLNANGCKQFNTAFRIPTRKEYILSLGLFFSKLKKSFYYKDIEKDMEEVKNVGSVSGSMFLMNAEKMMRYGMYDEHIFLYCEEVVLGLKLQNYGQKIALLPQLTFIHNHSVSINKSYKSEVSKRKLLVKSKLYVIKNYYKSSGIQYMVAYLLGKISIFETFLLSLFRR